MPQNIAMTFSAVQQYWSQHGLGIQEDSFLLVQA
jgi:hypothetical protein